MPPNTPDPFVEDELAGQIDPTLNAAPATAQELMSIKSPAPSFGNNIGAEAAYFENENKFNQYAGTALADAGGGVNRDPTQAYNAAIANNPFYNPSLANQGQSVFNQYLEGAPDAKQQLESQQFAEEQKARMALSPNVATIYNALSEDNKIEFERRKAESEMNVLFPPPVDPSQPSRALLAPDIQPDTAVQPLAPEQQAAPPAAPVDVQPSEPAAQTFAEKREAKQTQQAIDTLKLDPSDPTSEVRAKEFNQTLKDNELSRLKFLGQQNQINRDDKRSKEYNSLSDTGKVSYIKHKLALDKISGRSSSYGERTSRRSGRDVKTLTEEGERMKALRGIDASIKAGEYTYEDLANYDVLSPEKENEALNMKNFGAMSTGVAAEKEKVKADEAEAKKQAGIDAKKKLPPGSYGTAGPNILVVGPDGKSTEYPTESHWRGSDGKTYKKPTVPDPDNPGEVLWGNPVPPPGVIDVTDNKEYEDAARWVRDNPNDPRAAAIRAKLGI